MTTDEARLLKREARELRKALKELADLNLRFLTALDVEMEQPASRMRDRRIAELCNALEMGTDAKRYFTLRVDYRDDHKRKRKIKPLEVPADA